MNITGSFIASSRIVANIGAPSSITRSCLDGRPVATTTTTTTTTTRRTRLSRQYEAGIGRWHALGRLTNKTMMIPCASVPAQLDNNNNNNNNSSNSSQQSEEQDRQETALQEAERGVGVKIIGVGNRGISVLKRLILGGQLQSAECWAVDSDPKVLEAVCRDSDRILPVLVSKEGTSSASSSSPINADDLQRLIGRGASDAGGRGNIGAGDGGVAFVLAPAAALPGGPDCLLELVSSLKAGGHFTVAAITRPFGFEGPVKMGQADTLVGALDKSAHLVAVMEQEVLLQAFGEVAQLTVAEASEIADAALEHSVHSVMQAVCAREVLKSSRGALMWHGRDLRHYKRLLSPPLQQLLTCPGTAVLGRGLASMPATAAANMGSKGAEALLHLASDAVRAAAESPFLDGALEDASAVLCCLRMPAPDQEFSPGSTTTIDLFTFESLQTPEGERAATRKATQAAAGALRSMTGAVCDDFVLCTDHRVPTTTNNHVVEVEATLLVLRPPATSQSAQKNRNKKEALAAASVGVGVRGGGARTAAAASPPTPTATMPPPPPSSSSLLNAASPTSTSKTQRLPYTSWNMLSAMAGGAKPGSSSATKPPSPKTTTQPPRQPVVGGRSLFGNIPTSKAPMVNTNITGNGNDNATTATITTKGRAQPWSPSSSPAAPAAASAPTSPLQGPAQIPIVVRRPIKPGQSEEILQSYSTADNDNADIAASNTNTTTNTTGNDRVTVGDVLADSLTAQSLDLSLAAAKWRMQQRTDSYSQRRLIVWEVDELEPWEMEEKEGDGGYGGEYDGNGDGGEEETTMGIPGGGFVASLFGGKGKKKRREVDIKKRVSGVLAQDRDEAWEEEEGRNY